jgi:hypothetical protein
MSDEEKIKDTFSNYIYSKAYVPKDKKEILEENYDIDIIIPDPKEGLAGWTIISEGSTNPLAKPYNNQIIFEAKENTWISNFRILLNYSFYTRLIMVDSNCPSIFISDPKDIVDMVKSIVVESDDYKERFDPIPISTEETYPRYLTSTTTTAGYGYYDPLNSLNSLHVSSSYVTADMANDLVKPFADLNNKMDTNNVTYKL